ncbi:hypothetical protein HNQ59_001590 [Chitinivorax tropicus]|uniref:Immunity protein 52 domain-containing protein n=1 Tax=Chitinivorax tropicus TaxID=714531 RepID=A0A840MNH6_9PROT|nr:immunity 52 family protein [Chitinivorax tropicus]MBB5018302.1 hypothetical protein [Chitinivorax tropicus]
MKTPPPNIELTAQFRVDLEHPPVLADDLTCAFMLQQHLSQYSPKLVEWYLGGNSQEDALRYSAFDENGPTKAIEAVLTAQFRKQKNIFPMRGFGLWNGEDSTSGASLNLFIQETQRPSDVRFETDISDFLNYQCVLNTMLKMVDIWQPLFASAAPAFYGEKAVFKDRPGVGWMLYLPKVLTAQQVPEARALVPVMGKNEKGQDQQIGTIIVSVTDEPFSSENAEHVKTANAIEIRLVDQDLLPRYADL